MMKYISNSIRTSSGFTGNSEDKIAGWLHAFSYQKRYLKEIKLDYNYFKDSYKRADLQVDIENVRLDDIPDMIIQKMRNNEIMH